MGSELDVYIGSIDSWDGAVEDQHQAKNLLRQPSSWSDDASTQLSLGDQDVQTLGFERDEKNRRVEAALERVF